MKNTLLLLSLILSLTSYAKAPFQGKITYSLDFDGEEANEKQKDLPNEVVAYYKDGKMRFDIITSKFDFHIITNEANQEATLMMELKDQIILKMAFKTNRDKLKKEFDINEIPNTRQTLERKNIAGYLCKKVVIDTKEGEIYAYLTEELNAQNLNWLFDKNLNGTLMEFTLRDNDSNSGMVLRAKEVQTTTVFDAEFEIPADYMVVSEEGLKSMFGEDGMF